MHHILGTFPKYNTRIQYQNTIPKYNTKMAEMDTLTYKYMTAHFHGLEKIKQQKVHILLFNILMFHC